MNANSNRNSKIVDKKAALNPRLSYIQVRDDSKLTILSRQLASVGLQPSRSLINSTLAQACSLKRARDDSSKESVIKRAGGGVTKFGYKDRTPGGSGGGLKGCGSCLKIAGSGLKPKSPNPSSPPISLADKQPEQEMCPHTYITKVLLAPADKNDGRPSKALQPLHAYEFLPVTDEQIVAYSNDAIVAVRNNDLEALGKIHVSGRTLRSRNRFGESLLHMACRRSSPAVVAFLLDEAGVDPRVRDDYGRTPLHDACWRGRPALEIVEALLRAEPRLTFVRDVRGHVPFAYARREHWGEWREFLRHKRDLLLRRDEE